MFEHITIVLVNPSHPGNMGAAARAMKNMMFSQLCLVNPQRKVNAEAFARSSGAHDLLENARYCDDLKTALLEHQLVLGTSARPKVPGVTSLSPREASVLVKKHYSSQKVALLFGREHAGLSNEELALCHYHIQIPCNPHFSSLNLGAAVQILCYEFLCLEQETHALKKRSRGTTQTLATQAELNYLEAHWTHTLEKIDFYHPQNPRQLLQKLHALLYRAQPSSSEVAILRGILTAVDKRLA